MNLLDKNTMELFISLGSIINPDTDDEICMNEELVTFNADGTVHLGCSNALCSGWKMDKNGNIINITTQWSVAAMIAKEECRTQFGTFHFVFSLPNFRGSWPAIWLIDLHPAPQKEMNGCPPEIDIFEHFRKDGFLSRFHITIAFTRGLPMRIIRSFKTYWKLWPLDFNEIDLYLLDFRWNDLDCQWKEDHDCLQRIPKISNKPMNLIMNSGLGLDWKPKADKIEDFVVHKAEYQP